jgi:hypothetical protein
LEEAQDVVNNDMSVLSYDVQCLLYLLGCTFNLTPMSERAGEVEPAEKNRRQCELWFRGSVSTWAEASERRSLEYIKSQASNMGRSQRV